jgi:uncharacterized protein
MRRTGKILFFFLTLTVSVYCQKSVVGEWDGKIKMLTMNLNIHLSVKNINKNLEGYLSIPSQDLQDYHLPSFSVVKNKVHFELPSPSGIAKFDGTLKADSVKGTVVQAGINGVFLLGKSKEQNISKSVTSANDPLPYNEEEVAFKSVWILLAGTLTTPKEDKKFPAVILLTGNGPQNRDEDVSGFKVFQKLADYLTRHGIAVLRYDDRGIGGSTGNTMRSTTEDFAGDAVAAIEFLKKQKNIDPTKIGFIGHSEGAVIAAIASTISKDVAFIVTMSGPGVPGTEVLLEQQKLILQSGNVPNNLIQQNLDLQKKINEALINDKDLSSVRKDIQAFAEKDYAALNPNVKKAIKDKKAYINSTVDSQLMIFDNPWFRFYAKYDPAEAWKKVKVPLLLLYGDLDLQVPVNQNKPKVEAALNTGGFKNFKTVVFPKANHLYQNAKTGSPGEYSELKKEFVSGFLDTISNWIINTIK